MFIVLGGGGGMRPFALVVHNLNKLSHIYLSNPLLSKSAFSFGRIKRTNKQEVLMVQNNFLKSNSVFNIDYKSSNAR